MPNPVNLTEITVPDSKICQQATHLVAQVSSKCLCNHCMRTYFFGALLGQRDSLKYDRELFYLGAVLHDLGLTKRFSGQQRFEVDGADVARAFVIEHGLSAEKAEIVWDAIALHTSIGIASRKEPEIALVHLGAGMDFFGLRLEDIDSETVEKVFEAYPRLGATKVLQELIVSDISRKKLQVLAFTWMAEVGRNHIPGFGCPSFDDIVRNSPFSK